MLLRPVLSALKQVATRASVVVPDGGFQVFPDVKAHGRHGLSGTAHPLLSVAGVHGWAYTTRVIDLQICSTYRGDACSFVAWFYSE